MSHTNLESTGGKSGARWSRRDLSRRQVSLLAFGLICIVFALLRWGAAQDERASRAELRTAMSSIALPPAMHTGPVELVPGRCAHDHAESPDVATRTLVMDTDLTSATAQTTEVLVEGGWKEDRRGAPDGYPVVFRNPSFNDELFLTAEATNQGASEVSLSLHGWLPRCSLFGLF